MHPEGSLLHIGINYVITPPPEINKGKLLSFQQAMIDTGIDFDNVENGSREIVLLKKTPSLQIRVIAAPDAPVGQLLVVAPHPHRTPEDFGREAEAIVRAFHNTWRTPRQILSCDSTIRYLYEASEEHAFKELWETRLGQSQDALAVFGRRVLGGGIRFVMPPEIGEEVPTQIEVKIESFLRDTKKIFIEVEFKWPQPKPPGTPFEPKRLIALVDNYIEDQVRSFMAEGHDE
ncbi:MAG: hypothetical protein ACE5H9_03950 [Anaerolineae bacterium]